MSAADDMEDCEMRNGFGYPNTRIDANTAPVTQQVDQSYRKNDALPWVVLVALVAALALGVGIGALAGYHALSNRVENRIRESDERSARAEERADLLQYYVMELDAKFVAGKLVAPEDTFASKQSRAEK